MSDTVSLSTARLQSSSLFFIFHVRNKSVTMTVRFLVFYRRSTMVVIKGPSIVPVMFIKIKIRINITGTHKMLPHLAMFMILSHLMFIPSPVVPIQSKNNLTI